MPEMDIAALLASYRADAPLEEAWTLPAPFYLEPEVAERERSAVFARTWQSVGRSEQVREPGCYLTAEVAGEPIAVVRGGDHALRAFFNVCRHHAAAVLTEPQGRCRALRCPYHGWTYGLEGQLRGTPDFAGVRDFDREQHGLVPLQVAEWEGFVFIQITPGGPSLEEFLGPGLRAQVARLDLGRLRFVARRRYEIPCNWKVFVDNYLDGGYHVPGVHRGLGSVLDYAHYEIETGAHHCLQHSPMVTGDGDGDTGAVRSGERACYYWLYPNFMLNCYQGTMDTNLVLPLGIDRTEVVFDYYFADPADEAKNLHSIAVSERIQDEDVAICASVQRGLRSRAYGAGRLSVRREKGEHLFHRLLHKDLNHG